VLFYVGVDDLEASTEKAKALGAEVVLPPTEVPGMGSFAWLKDLEGTIFGLWKAAEEA
jgi:predicted enzyme related to lactoylglutathione lyase